MALQIMQMYAAAQLRRERTFRDRKNPFDTLPDRVFRNRFRFPKVAIIELAEILHDDLVHRTKRSNALQVTELLLVALRFYATGTFYTEIGDRNNINKSTVCRVVRDVTNAIVRCHHY